MTSFHDYRAKVTGYSPAPNRYFVRRTAPVGKVPTRNWNDQKATVTGYTACSNQYYATRARIAHHPADKTFGSFSGVNMTVEGIAAQTQQAPPTPEPPKPLQHKHNKHLQHQNHQSLQKELCQKVWDKHLNNKQHLVMMESQEVKNLQIMKQIICKE
jgi:hypothetical protein